MVNWDFNTGFVRGKKNCMCKKTLDPNVETAMWKRKVCGRGKDADFETDWHPIALNTHITIVGLFRTWDSCRRHIVPPLAWILAWKCPSLALTPQGITGLLAQGVPPTAWGPLPWILSPGERHTSESQRVCRHQADATCFSRAWGSLSISGFREWAEDMGGGTTTACAEHWKCSCGL